jgi:hypothetical protein
MRQRRQEVLGQVTFLRLLTEDFNCQNQKFLEAWPILIKYDNVPKEMNEKEWSRVTYALANCYSSVRFLFTIAQLVKARVIDSRLLYILYYHEVTGYLTDKLRFLIQWCGTGLDLAADYDSYELARIVIALIELIKELNNVHAKHGADLFRNGYKAVTARFEERTRDFLSDPGRFSVLSDNYVDNYIEIIKK